MKENRDYLFGIDQLDDDERMAVDIPFTTNRISNFSRKLELGKQSFLCLLSACCNGKTAIAFNDGIYHSNERQRFTKYDLLKKIYENEDKSICFIFRHEHKKGEEPDAIHCKLVSFKKIDGYNKLVIKIKYL